MHHARLAAFFLALGLGCCLFAADTPVGVVSHIKVISDKVEDVTTLADWKKTYITDGMSDQEKAIAIWKSVVKYRHQTAPPQEKIQMGGCAHDPMKTIHVYGYGQCCCASSNIDISTNKRSEDNDFDYDLVSGRFPNGQEAHGVKGRSTHAPNAGFIVETMTGIFHLAPDSPGVKKGIVIPIFATRRPNQTWVLTQSVRHQSCMVSKRFMSPLSLRVVPNPKSDHYLSSVFSGIF